MQTLLVCGGREWKDRFHVYQILDQLQFKFGPFSKLVHGDCRGADRMAGAWGTQQDNLEVVAVPARWDEYGKAAGMIRNGIMLADNKVEVVAAFSEDLRRSAGTKDMVIRSMVDLNVKVLVHAYGGDDYRVLRTMEYPL